jgi:uncharacterized protein
LRLVVLALQDRLAYGTTFEAAMAGLFGQAAPPTAGSAEATARGPNGAAPTAGTLAGPATSVDLAALIRDAAHELSEYQRLTAEGKLGEAGQRLDVLKQKLEQLQRERR